MTPNLDTRRHRGNGRYEPPMLGSNIGAGKGGGYSDFQIWNFMQDIRYEPAWRSQAEIDSAFYDGDQLKSETLMRMQELGIPPIVVNLTAPIIDSITGWEAISRSNLKCLPEDEESFEIARALNIKLREMMRMTRFDHMVGRQFKSAAKIGIGWLEVSRETDPFKYPYRVLPVPWREMYVDHRSREEDYSDARYQIRRKWFDADILKAHMPKFKKEIENAMGGFRDAWLNEWEELGYNDYASSLAMSLEQEGRFTLEEEEWRNVERGRIAVYEIMYQVPRQVEALRFPNGMTVELNIDSPQQIEAIATGQAQYVAGVTKPTRQAVYIGPHKAEDRELELGASHYIPMVCWRKDGDGSVYGPVRRLRSPQEAYNSRYARMLYDLASRKYVVDDDAVDDHGKTSKELNKVNAYVIQRSDRVGEGISEMSNLDTSQITYQLLLMAQKNMFDSVGINEEFVGAIQSAGQSGVAIDSLINQTQQVLGSFVDNYRQSKRKAGEMLMAYYLNDIKDVDNLAFESEDEPRKKIFLNAKNADGTRTNDVLTVRMQVALGEVPATQTYLQQKLQSLAEIIKSLPPEVQPALIDLVIRASALDDGEEILERVRQITGYGPEPKDPEKRKALQQQQAQQQALQQQIQELEMAYKAAEVKEMEARAALDMEKAKKLADSDTDLTEAKTLVELAKAGDVETQAEIRHTESRAKLIDSSARLARERNSDIKSRQREKAAA